MSASRGLVIFSGIAPDDSGTGRLVQTLIDQARSQNIPVEVIWKRFSPHEVARLLLRGKLKAARREMRQTVLPNLRSVLRLLHLGFWQRRKLVLLHPQIMGFRLYAALLRLWPTEVGYFVLDNSFFCIRSYNHRSGFDPCFDCLGDTSCAAKAAGCEPFPIDEKAAYWYVDWLKSYVGRTSKIRFLCQTQGQKRLIERHFSKPGLSVEVTGLWVGDFPDEFPNELSAASANEPPQIVFHAHKTEAKGFYYALELAKRLPQYRFVFPFGTNGLKNVPDNCRFAQVTWHTGLKELVINADLVLVPSVWSAPIEGAVVKSLIYSRRVAGIEISTAFIQELSSDVICKLSSNAATAAEQIPEILDQKAPPLELRRSWFDDFKASNISMIHKIARSMDAGERKLG